jgi:hypothetical protein
MTTHYKYIHEAVWLPTYAAIALFVFGTVQNSNAATLVMIVALIVCRRFLELLYRLAFGDERLTVRIGLLAFGSQLVAWGRVGLGFFTVHQPYETETYNPGLLQKAASAGYFHVM